MKCAPFQSPSKRKPIREFCGVKRNSERLPLTVLLNGMLPKLEPMLEPAFLSRQTAVKSINPMGTMHVLPSRINAGAGPSGTASHGLVGGAFGGCAAPLITGIAKAVAAGAGGIYGVVLAISPKALSRGKTNSRLSSVALVLILRSIIFLCSSSANFS